MDGEQLTLDDELEFQADENQSWEEWWATLPPTPPDGDEPEREAA